MTDSNERAPAGEQPEGWIEVGFVARAHGIRGELQLRPHWPGSEAFKPGEEIELRLGSRVLRAPLQQLRAVPKGYIAALGLVSSRNDAESWQGATCWAVREELETGEYYLNDLVGATVFCAGKVCGKVQSVVMYPTLDALLVQSPSGEMFEQPLLDDWVERIDAEAKEVHLLSLDGVIE